MCRSGSAADTQNVAAYVKRMVEEHAMERNGGGGTGTENEPNDDGRRSFGGQTDAKNSVREQRKVASRDDNRRMGSNQRLKCTEFH